MQLFDLEFETTSLSLLSEKLVSAAKQRHAFTLLPTALNDIYLSTKDSNIFKKISNFTYRTPDGMPLVWLARLAGFPQSQRIYGPELLQNICDDGQISKLRHFFFGGQNAQLLQSLQSNLLKKYPQLIIAGTYAPPFRPTTLTENKQIAKLIRQAHPHIIWVGLGSQKQIFWIDKWRRQFPNISFIAVGAAFDFLSGSKKQAPAWIRHLGFEWLFRFICEPRRLFVRYIAHFPATTYFYSREIIKLAHR